MSTSETPPPDSMLEAATAAIREHTDLVPEMALVLGSGLGDLADAAGDAVRVPASDIPGYPESTVDGHDGRLVFGQLGGTPVVFVQGRVHAYEGYSIRQLTFPIRLVHALGASRLLVTNSAGGIHRNLRPGTLMFITDHINAAFGSPLVGRGGSLRDLPEAQAEGAGATKQRSVSEYDLGWTARAEAVARDLGITTRRGTYIWVQGPSYETKAEIRAFERWSADAVGMSTVPEVIQARRLGMSVLGLSTITNPAAGLGDEALDHADVLEVGKRVRADLARLVQEIVRTA